MAGATDTSRPRAPRVPAFAVPHPPEEEPAPRRDDADAEEAAGPEQGAHAAAPVVLHPLVSIPRADQPAPRPVPAVVEDPVPVVRGVEDPPAPPLWEDHVAALAPPEAAPRQLAVTEAYRRFARETQAAQLEDYYREPGHDPVTERPVLLAEDIAPVGRRWLRGEGGRGPLAITAVAVLAAAAVGWAVTRPTGPGSPPPLPPVPRTVVVDATQQVDGEQSLPVARAATAGRAYAAAVPAGWKASSTPTIVGGRHTDLTLEQPTLRLSVIVRSQPAAAAAVRVAPPGVRAVGGTTDVLGTRATSSSWNAGGDHHQVLVAVRGAVRYTVETRGPIGSAGPDAARLDMVLRGLALPR